MMGYTNCTLSTFWTALSRNPGLVVRLCVGGVAEGRSVGGICEKQGLRLEAQVRKRPQNVRLQVSSCIFFVNSIGIHPYFDMGKHRGSVRLGHVQKILDTMYSKKKTDLLHAQRTCSYIIAHHRTL